MERKFHLEQVGKFKDSIYHWTTDLNFWYTGANLGIKKGGGTQFSIIRGLNASHPTSQGYKKLNIKFKGFDTTFVIKKNTRNLVGTLKNNNTNIQVDFFSNLPGVQLYSAQNLNYKKKLFPYQGICLETQYFPDSPNKKNFPSTLIKPNKRYTCFTKIKIN